MKIVLASLCAYLVIGLAHALYMAHHERKLLKRARPEATGLGLYYWWLIMLVWPLFVLVLFSKDDDDQKGPRNG